MEARSIEAVHPGGTVSLHCNAVAPSPSRQVALLAAAASLLALSSAATAKAVQLAIRPTASQLVAMDHGSELVVSRVGTSEIWMQVPAADDTNRVAIPFVFINKSDKPVNVGPEYVSSDLISVVPYAKLIDEQKSRESTRRVGHFLPSLAGRSLPIRQVNHTVHSIIADKHRMAPHTTGLAQSQ